MRIDAKHTKYRTTKKLATAQVECGILLMTQQKSKYNLIESYMTGEIRKLLLKQPLIQLKSSCEQQQTPSALTLHLILSNGLMRVKPKAAMKSKTTCRLPKSALKSTLLDSCRKIQLKTAFDEWSI